ncbi:MAG: ABC transporter ATP-binding protein/permease [Oscillospiraceae bacterium]|nr:ABC transporter ATP-binding protein/permease [Oscillospiraceae bacterium]
MLKLVNITKDYPSGESVVHALKGVSLEFRKSEFVAVLGHSGCGKTTLLNIIGGLDRYTQGDLIINGRSTKNYKDRDWDTYRNHSIGFVFQSYNLIPHQSVLQNVELALTIGGVSMAQRRKRAEEALIKVGLGDQMKKRPNQLSGGQMQRVAIARALVNDPEILLADEPTGALDTETSIQVMELLKEVSRDRLVVMVTHNPELAEQYATRIVHLKDGLVTDDSAPFGGEEEAAPEAKQGKAGMSFLTSLALSANNLRTKKGRTILTAFAGSIGIIGIALILSLSNGVNRYIADIQKETMTSYPISITSTTYDLSGLMGQAREARESFRSGSGRQEETFDGVRASYRNLEASEVITTSIKQNNLSEFKKYLDNPSSEIRQYLGENGVVYTYDISFSVYTKDRDGAVLDTNSSASQLVDGSNRRTMNYFSLMSRSSAATGADNFSQLMAGSDGAPVSRVVTDSYDVLKGRWPEKYDEAVIVLSRNNTMSAETLYQLGYMTADQYKAAAQAITDGGEAEPLTLSYEELMDHYFSLVPACDLYTKGEDGLFTRSGDSDMELESLAEKGLQLKIVGVIRPGEGADNANISTNVAYTAALTDWVIAHTDQSEIVRAQEADPGVNVLSGMAFEAATKEEKLEDAKKYISGMGISEKASLYTMIMYSRSSRTQGAGTPSEGGTQPGTEAPAEPEEPAETQPGTGASSSAGGNGGTQPGAGEGTGTQPGSEASSTGGQTQQPGASMSGEAGMAAMLDRWLEGSPDEEILLSVYDTYLGGATLDENLRDFGKVSYEKPSSISIYIDTFEDKNSVSECIERYNENVEEDKRITYTDYVALLTSSITNIVDVISYVLIAFVAVSLVVSSIMIGIITHISVLERTKEIGILRALGASKRNISQVFNAETFIIGFISGLIGVTVSMLLTIPINAIIKQLADTDMVKAALPWDNALVLILISMVITIIGGLIPARSAARKDPVVALRTE